MKKHFKILLILSFIVISTGSLFSQKSEVGHLDFEGKVLTNNKGLAGAIIEIFDGSTKTKTITSKMFGNFSVKLKFNKTYTLKIAKEGMVSKSVEVNTTVKDNSFIYSFEFEISLFNYVDGLGTKEISSPVTKISFDEKQKEFDFDRVYTNKIKAEVDKIYEKQQKLKNQEYTTLITEADKELKAKNYEKAIDLYDKAIDADPFAEYPDNQIDKCEKLIKEKEDAEKNGDKKVLYAKAIKLANEQFDKKEYEKAIPLYNKALNIDPYSDFADKRIDECEKRIDDLADAERNYKKAISAGNKNFAQKKYDSAKTNFEEALSIKPDEQYPKDKLVEISKLLGDLAEQSEKDKIDAEYNKIVKLADESLKSKKYNDAKTNYTKALGIKPTEQYPKDKLKEVGDLLLAQANAAQQEKDYLALITEADKLLSDSKFEDSKAKYNEALAIKSAEQYPKDKIAEIDKKLSEIAAEKAKEKQYKDLIASGDNNFNKEDYENAKANFTKASALKPNETYPKNKLIEIDGKLQALADQKLKDEEYNELIKTADTKFAANNLSGARTDYLAASQMKQDKQYPKDKVTEIDKKLADIQNQKSINAKYDKAISTADVYFNAQKYADAKNNYQKAIDLKPNEQYPKDKLAKAESLMAEAAKKAQADKEYKAQMKKAENLLTIKKYEEARVEFVKASDLKPDEQLPKDKIANIDVTLSVIAANKKKQEEINRQYKSLITMADDLFKSKKYTSAKGVYTKAKNLKSKEQYPKDKIAEINAILDKEKVVVEKKPDVVKPQPKLKELKFANAAEKRKYLSNLAKQYPDRKTIENYSETNGKQITRIIINNGGVAHEYRKVKQPWGAEYFFKDGNSISKSIFYGGTK